MAKMIMTIDSDSEIESKIKSGKKDKKGKKSDPIAPPPAAEEDEGMMLSSDVYLKG
jgi:hypothetical protein